MKSFLKLILQRTLGFQNYLFWFSVLKIKFLKWDAYEKPLFSIFGKITKKGLILDVGANIGIISVHFAKQFPDSKIIGFEPVPFNQTAFEKVCKYFKLNNVVLEKFALGNSNEKTTIYVPVQNNVTMQGLANIKETDTKNAISYTIDVKKLDDVESYKNQLITAIKIDVENFEYEVLLGAKLTIERNKPILYVELWDNENRKNSIDFLTNLGYTAHYFNTNSWQKFNLDKPITGKSQNFLFLPHSKA
ncbi:MAG: FkbM family methyltransferase [Bacteroidota bacterium]